MLDRTRIEISCYWLSKDLNITNKAVHEVINEYIDYCKELLASGEKVDFVGLVSIVPDRICSEFYSTLAYNCLYVADKLSLPYNTVYTIMHDYINSAIKNLEKNIIVEIRGLVTIKPIIDGDGLIIHSHISQALRTYIENNSNVVSSLRVHTAKSLKDRIYKK